MVKTRSSTRHSARADGGDNEGTTNGSEDVILIVDNFSSNSSNSKLTSSTKAKDNNKSATQNKKRKYRPSEKKSEGTNGRGTILAYFKSESSSSSNIEEDIPEKDPKKIKIDANTRQFLESGIPEVVMKAQKFVEKKRNESDYLSLVGFFPKLQLIPPNISSPIIDLNTGPVQFPIGFTMKKEVEINYDSVPIDSLSLTEFFHTDISPLEIGNTSSESPVISPSYQAPICCRPISNLLVSDDDFGISYTNSVPWIEDCRTDIEELKDLCCDKEALNKLKFWLKQWKTDIKDDGGTSRKIDLKKKRRDSGDSFVTSDEDDEDVKKKSVLLTGPPGCGKTSAVYAAARHYGFHVVEVNFSSRRPGKDVLQKVEEAVLSHRFKSSKNCLLLFEDIDLVDQKEDEGFHCAVSRLITNAVRPIVMTTSYLGQLSLDPKLERKEPLVIQFALPNPSQIVHKVLCPMIFTRASTLNIQDSEESDDQEQQTELPAQLSLLLDSICRHGRNDVRQIINQTQFLFTFSSSSKSISISNIHQHSIQSDLLLDLGFIRSSLDSLLPLPGASTTIINNNSEDCDDVDDMSLSVKARNKIALKRLNSVTQMLSFACDLNVTESIYKEFGDCTEDTANQITALKSNYFNSNFLTSFASCCKSGVREQIAESLIIETDKEFEIISKGYKLFDEIGEYCDNIFSNGGWESASYVRSIIKRNNMDSIGRLAKRNGRVTSYFNRLDRSFTTRICESFSFDKELAAAKDYSKFFD